MQSKIAITEIFYSLQGESSYAGLPCIFIRLSGCNLRCNYCDAGYTWMDGDLLAIEEILSTIRDYPCNLVEVTGGEPLHQQQCLQLLDLLLQENKTVLLETNGSMEIKDVPAEVISILDVKCPDSGSGNSFHPDNLKEIKRRSLTRPGSCELKFVLSSEEDYFWAKNFLSENELHGVLPILFSPVQNRIEPRDLAGWIMDDGLVVRLQLQLHTIIWPDIPRGV